MKNCPPKRALFGLALLLSVGGAAYAWYDYRFPSWKEEVVLADGRKIVIKQRRDFVEGYGTWQAWVTFDLPEAGGKRVWDGYMQPVLLAVSKEGRVYIAGWPTGEKQLVRYRYPRFGYVAFEWDGADFRRVPFLAIPEDLRQEENLLICLPDGRFISWDMKRQRTCDDSGQYILGQPRKIDLFRMQEWARKQAARQHIEPLSE